QVRARPKTGALEPQGRLLGAAGHPPLINRQKELALLYEALGRALRRRGGTTVLLGEAGVGKTRLAEELVREMQRRGGRVLTGHAYETERGLPFAPWVDVLRAGLRLYDEGFAPRPNPVWQGELAKLLPELESRAAPRWVGTPRGSSMRFRTFCESSSLPGRCCSSSKICSGPTRQAFGSSLFWYDGSTRGHS